MIETLAALHPFEQIGMAGFGLYILVFTSITLRWLCADSIIFFVLSLASAMMILTGLQISFNLAAAFMQGFKVTMCAVGIGLRLWRRRSGGQSGAERVSQALPAPGIQRSAHIGRITSAARSASRDMPRRFERLAHRGR